MNKLLALCVMLVLIISSTAGLAEDPYTGELNPLLQGMLKVSASEVISDEITRAGAIISAEMDYYLSVGDGNMTFDEMVDEYGDAYCGRIGDKLISCFVAFIDSEDRWIIVDFDVDKGSTVSENWDANYTASYLVVDLNDDLENKLSSMYGNFDELYKIDGETMEAVYKALS